MRTTKAQSLRIRTVWSAPLLFTAWTYNTSACYIQKFKTQASFWSWAGRFESTLVKNPEDRFSRDEAHLLSSNEECSNPNLAGPSLGDLGEKDTPRPKLADCSLFWAEGEVKMYRTYREIEN